MGVVVMVMVMVVVFFELVLIRPTTAIAIRQVLPGISVVAFTFLGLVFVLFSGLWGCRGGRVMVAEWFWGPAVTQKIEGVDGDGRWVAGVPPLHAVPVLVLFGDRRVTFLRLPLPVTVSIALVGAG